MERVAALGLDVGKRRVGVAGCDGTGLIARELTTIQRSSFVRDVEQLRAIVRERQVTVLVVGMPYTLRGEVGQQAERVRQFAERVAAALELPLEYADERLTSVEAENQLRASGRFSQQNKGAIDARAAAIILQQWLDRRRIDKKPLSLD